MAQTDNFFNLKGKLGNLIFCVRNGKTYVKPYSGGFVNGNSQTHPNVKASQSRFSEVAHFIGNFKKAILPLLWRQKDGSFHNQLVSLFYNIKRHFPEDSLYNSLKRPETLKFLKQESFNKHHKLPAHTVYFDTEQNHLEIKTYHLKSFEKKYPRAVLEVAFCWLEIRADASVIPHNIQTQLVEVNYQDTFTTEKMEVTPSPSDPDAIFWPFVCLSLLDQNDALRRIYHPQQSMWAGVL